MRHRARAFILAAALVLTPLSVQAADLVVWWEKGANPEEDAAVKEIIAAFEQDSGKQVELVFQQQDELQQEILAALDAGHPPDFAFGVWIIFNVGEWAFDDRLVDLSDAVGHFSDLFDSDALHREMLLNGKTGQKALYALPMTNSVNHVQVWKSLLESVGFTLADIPREWDAFWLFWCDQVQPAVRLATGRDDIWGVGLPMSATAGDTYIQFYQFLAAQKADYVTPDGRLVIDDPEVRRQLIKMIDSYTAVYGKGCTPPESVTWADDGNNKAFLAQMVVMTPNESLSIPNALKSERPDDYYENVATLEWPLGPSGEAFPIYSEISPGMIFKDGRNVSAAKEFVRFLVADGWLMHYLDFSGERFLPTISKLLDQPFWLDPSDPHRMAAVMQLASRPLDHNYAAASGDWRHQLVDQELVWSKAIHRVVTENISPEQVVDEAIARIKEILSE
jgi:multiple sugar transport system substrate-binding protein